MAETPSLEIERLPPSPPCCPARLHLDKSWTAGVLVLVLLGGFYSAQQLGEMRQLDEHDPQQQERITILELRELQENLTAEMNDQDKTITRIESHALETLGAEAQRLVHNTEVLRQRLLEAEQKERMHLDAAPGLGSIKVTREPQGGYYIQFKGEHKLLDQRQGECRKLFAANTTPNTKRSSGLTNTTEECKMTQRYVASPWEQYWGEHILEVASHVGMKYIQLVGPKQEQDDTWGCGCELMKDNRDAVDSWMALAEERATAGWDTNRMLEAHWPAGVMSYFSIESHCKGQDVQEVARVPIEPLVGFLRHPRAVCLGPGLPLILSKDYLLPNWNFEISPQPKGARRAFFFDLGASTYNAGAGGASGSWFVDEYARRGIQFDRILAWEMTQMSPAHIFRAMPNDVVDRVSYYNIPVSARKGHPHNPLRTLQNIATVDDFVVIKLDIDHSIIETAIVKQILESSEIAALIDEFYFEHHVLRNPVINLGWAGAISRDLDTGHVDHIGESYRIFSALRDAGIRAHSWV